MYLVQPMSYRLYSRPLETLQSMNTSSKSLRAELCMANRTRDIHQLENIQCQTIDTVLRGPPRRWLGAPTRNHEHPFSVGSAFTVLSSVLDAFTRWQDPRMIYLCISVPTNTDVPPNLMRLSCLKKVHVHCSVVNTPMYPVVKPRQSLRGRTLLDMSS